MLKVAPKHLKDNGAFLCHTKFNYGAKTYKGLPLGYSDIIKKNGIYLMEYTYLD